MIKRGPKLSKRALATLGNPKNRSNDVLTTTDDFIEEGAADEESGDRWLGTDLAKALRFYQKAYLSYQNAIKVDNSGPDLLQDAYYNALRLLFLVYTQYTKNDSIDINQLPNVGEVLTGDGNSVVQEISAIVIAHERSIDIRPGSPPSDLLFNAALVYTDAIDDTDDPVLIEEYATKGIALFKELLRRQVDKFHEYLLSAEDDRKHGSDNSNGGSTAAASASGSASQVTLSYTPISAVQPPEILETIISGLALVQAVLESVRTPESLNAAVAFMGPFSTDICKIGDELVQTYSLESEDAVSIDADLRNEYALAKTYVHALSCSDLEQVYSLWENLDLPHTPQRYMMGADCIGSILERLGVNTGPNAHADTYWAALTKMNNHFKQAQELLNTEYQERKAKKITDADLGVGLLISQISKVYIARSDIDLQRSQIHNDQGQKNSQVLLNNAKAFLKNAMNLAKVSGGIRERAMEKVQRERCRYEAVSRLCVLEGKLSPEELNSIMGAGKWEDDLAAYKELWYFRVFFGLQ